jgi:putative transposase
MRRLIVLGCLVTYEDKTYRVTGIFNSGKIELSSLSTNHRFKVLGTEVNLVEPDPKVEEKFTSRRMMLLQKSEATPEEVAKAVKVAGCIKKYHAKKITRQQAIQELEVSAATFTRYLKKYDSELGDLSLVRNVRGRKSGTRMLSDSQEIKVEEAINKFIKKKKRIDSFSELYEFIDTTCNLAGIPTPSSSAVNRRLKALGNRPLYSLLHGREAMLQKFDLKPGMICVETILTMVQIDHTRVDVIICDEQRRPLMRPWLTVVIDLKSRVILGYYVALHPPGPMSVAMAMLSACFPKDNFPNFLGGGDDALHRFWGVPSAVGSDNAAEFTSDAFEATLLYYSIQLILRPVGKKHFGGHIERLIGTIMGRVHFLPGTTYSNSLSKGAYDSERESALTFEEFSRWFSMQVDIYHGRAHEGLGRMAPYEVWEKEVKLKGEGYVPEIPGDFRTFALDFFPSITRTVQTKGVKFNGVYYSSSILTSLVGQRLNFKFSPLNLNKIWLRTNDIYVEIPYSDINNPAISYSEYWAFYRSKSRRPGELIDERLHEIRMNSIELVDDAEIITKRARQHKAAKSSMAETLNVLDYGMQPTFETKPLSTDQSRKKLGWER